MKKIFSWLSENILFVSTLFLLIFIPLYPKLPLINIRNTWVYVRLEDFFVLTALIIWLFLFLKRKVTIKTPLTLPIIFFWIIGAVATIHGVILIFPTTANVFPNVAFLTFLRHVEYMSLFFVAYSSIRNRKQLISVIVILVITLLGVVAYGFGQKFAGFPAYLTMNEEYAKGIAIKLSDLSRVPSTFAGHYDLAAYLVLIIPILISLVFGIKNWFARFALLGASLFGFVLLFQTVSRVSFFALIVVLIGILFFQKKRFIIFALPALVLFAFLLISFKPTLLNRFSSTVKQVDVLVDGKTGQAVGEVSFVPVSYFRDKIIRQQRVVTKDQLDMAMVGQSTSTSSPSAVLPFELLNPDAQVPRVHAANVSNGENLPQGTGYINLSLSPVINRVGNFFYELPPNLAAKSSAQVLIFHGDFIIKRASAYDLSFTTRFQGEWPHAILAFERNILIGSGYGSVSLAVDNNYFRMLGETGILGLLAFFAIFLALAVYIQKTWEEIDSPLVKSFILGFCGGVIGLGLNATLIDVFEASKIAYLLWLLTGITFAILVSYHARQLALVQEIKKALVSKYAVTVYLLVLAVVIFSPMLTNYFVGDDFTWFRWVDCKALPGGCPSFISTLISYFTQASGFFWRPGTKLFFYFMYPTFWLNQNVYHAVAILLHFTVALLFYFLARKILKNNLLAAGAASIFLIMSGYSEAVFWISAIGFLFNAVFALLALLLFINYSESKKKIFYFGSLISMFAALMFHEMGIIIPFLIILYESLKKERINIRNLFRSEYLPLFIPDIIYLVLRFVSASHWQGGDYSYNLLKLPFNFVGNVIGYVFLTLFGPLSLQFYEVLRDHLKNNLIIASVSIILVIAVIVLLLQKFAKKIPREALFGLGFFVISLLPFLGLGNIASRYSYLSSLGLIIILVLAAKKLFEFLQSYGREIAISATTLIVLIFVLLHIFQLQLVHQDWHGAGEQARNFLVSIDDAYSSYWSTEPMEIHFINVPTRVGQAWVFPVGLPDALWFAFKNPNLNVVLDSQVTYDLQTKIGRNVRAFKFNSDGSLTEIQPPKIVQTPNPIPAPRTLRIK